MLASNPLRNSRPVLVATMSRTWNVRCVLAESLGRTRPGSGTSAQVIREFMGAIIVRQIPSCLRKRTFGCTPLHLLSV